jgi:hypothetical protein
LNNNPTSFVCDFVDAICQLRHFSFSGEYFFVPFSVFWVKPTKPANLSESDGSLAFEQIQLESNKQLKKTNEFFYLFKFPAFVASSNGASAPVFAYCVFVRESCNELCILGDAQIPTHQKLCLLTLNSLQPKRATPEWQLTRVICLMSNPNLAQNEDSGVLCSLHYYVITIASLSAEQNKKTADGLAFSALLTEL